MALDTAGLPKPSSPSGDVLRDACIVTPTYNERGNVPRLVEAISESCGSSQFRMVVMDDASPDGTADAVDEIRSRFPNVRAVRRKGERGYGKAVAEGILTALDMGVKYVVTMDADFSHSPEAIPELLKEAVQNDLVI